MNTRLFFKTAILATILSVFSGAIAQAAEEPAKGKPLPTVTVQKVQKIALSLYYEGTGSIEASRIAQLASPAEGPIVESPVREGDVVKAGDLIIRLGRNRSAEALWQSAAEDLRREEQEVRNVEQLVSSGAIPAEQRTIARANLQKARAQAVRLRESMEDFAIKAPWDGVVSKVLVRDGNFVAPRAPLVEMYDPKSLVLRFSVPEAQVAQVQAGMPVEFHLDAYKETAIPAKVTRIYPELDRKTRTLTLEATPDTKLALKPGMFARLQARMGHSAEALSIPAQAIKTTPKGEQIVFVVKEAASGSDKTPAKEGGVPEGQKGGGKTGTVERRVVSTGMASGDMVEITQGLNSGEIIVIEGGEKLKDGAEVRIAPGEGKGKS